MGAAGRSGLGVLFSGGKSARKRTVGSALGLVGFFANPNCIFRQKLAASEGYSLGGH